MRWPSKQVRQRTQNSKATLQHYFVKLKDKNTSEASMHPLPVQTVELQARILLQERIPVSAIHTNMETQHSSVKH